MEALAWLLVLCACPAAALVTALAIGLAIGNRGQTSKLTLRLDELDRTVGELRARLELIGSTGPPPSVPSSSAPPLDERTGPVAEPAPPPLIPPAPRSDEPAPVVLKDEARPAALDVGLEVPPTEAPAAPAAEGVTAAVEPAGPPPDEVEDEAAAAEAGPDVGPAIDAAARPDGGFEVVTRSGKNRTGIDAIAWAQDAAPWHSGRQLGSSCRWWAGRSATSPTTWRCG